MLQGYFISNALTLVNLVMYLVAQVPLPGLNNKRELNYLIA